MRAEVVAVSSRLLKLSDGGLGAGEVWTRNLLSQTTSRILCHMSYEENPSDYPRAPLCSCRRGDEVPARGGSCREWGTQHPTLPRSVCFDHLLAPRPRLSVRQPLLNDRRVCSQREKSQRCPHPGHAMAVQSVCFYPCGTRFVTSGEDGLVKVSYPTESV